VLRAIDVAATTAGKLRCAVKEVRFRWRAASGSASAPRITRPLTLYIQGQRPSLYYRSVSSINSSFTHAAGSSAVASWRPEISQHCEAWLPSPRAA
jgi:hypothetical protein